MSDLSSRVSLLLVFALSGSALIWSGAAPGTMGPRPVAGPKAADAPRHVLLINGDRDQDVVSFDHQAHRERQGGAEGCIDCHHVQRPDDQSTPCFSCHSDLERTTSIFDHAAHQQKLKGNDSCAECHDLALPKNAENAKTCRQCHERNMRMSGLDLDGFRAQAPSYEDALHGLCVDCHEKKAGEIGRPQLADCDTCHQRVHHDPEEQGS